MDTTKARILEAAGNVFAQKGFEAGTVREICQLADVNLAAINYHFGDKRRLYLAAVSHAYSSRQDEMAWPSGPPERRPKMRLRAWVGAMMERLLGEDRQPWHMQLMMREVASPDVACEALVKEYIRPHFEYLAAILKELLPRRSVGRAAGAVGLQRGRARFVLPLCPADHAAAAWAKQAYGDADSAGAGRPCHGDDAGGAGRADRPSARRGVRAMSWVALKMLTGNKRQIHRDHPRRGLCRAADLAAGLDLLRHDAADHQPDQGHRRRRHLGHGSQRAVRRRRQTDFGKRSVSRPRRRRGRLGRAAVQGTDSGPHAGPANSSR